MNEKHEPYAEHYVKDKFGKGTDTRNWNKKNDPGIESEEEEAKLSEKPDTDAGSEKIEQRKTSNGDPQLEQ